MPDPNKGLSSHNVHALAAGRCGFWRIKRLGQLCHRAFGDDTNLGPRLELRDRLTSRPALAKDRTLLLTVILADAINLGLNKMAEACPRTSIAKLSWLCAWYR